MKLPGYVAMTGLLLFASPAVFASDGVPGKAELQAAATDLGHRYDASYGAQGSSLRNGWRAPSGPVVRGRTALHDYYVKRFGCGAQGHAITVNEAHVKGNGGYSIATFSVNVPGKNGELHMESGSLVAIYQHDADGWHLSWVEPSVPAS